jgi:hypothetical protein
MNETNTTIVYRDMLAVRARTIVDDLSDIRQPLQQDIRASIEAGANKGTTRNVVRWQVLSASDMILVNIWPMFHEDDTERFRAMLILPWEDVDQSFDESCVIGSDNDEVVYAEIFAAMRAGRDHGYITTNDDQRVVAWSVVA